MSIDWDIKVGDVLTSTTIAISVIALLMSWSKDVEQQQSIRANDIRSAASAVLSNMYRWQRIQSSLYRDAKPIFIETSEKISADCNVINAHYYLSEAIEQQRIVIENKILEEKVFTSYIDLIAAYPASRQVVQHFYGALTRVEQESAAHFESDSENQVLNFACKQGQQGERNMEQDVSLDTSLAKTAEQYGQKFIAQSDEAIRPFKEYLFCLITQGDEQVLSEDGHQQCQLKHIDT